MDSISYKHVTIEKKYVIWYTIRFFRHFFFFYLFFELARRYQYLWCLKFHKRRASDGPAKTRLKANKDPRYMQMLSNENLMLLCIWRD